MMSLQLGAKRREETEQQSEVWIQEVPPHEKKAHAKVELMGSILGNKEKRETSDSA
jgi:hypothetical protein